jgi:Cu/Ag efflux protein CusF
MRNAKATVLLLMLLLAGCAKSTDQEKSSAPLKRFSIHGEIMRLEPDGRLATIHHQKIEGLMEGMTMTFPVKDPQEFSALQTGNCIEAALFEQGDSFWVAEIKHLDTPADKCVAPPADAPKTP